MIKTTIAGEALTRALDKQQRFVDRQREDLTTSMQQRAALADRLFVKRPHVDAAAHLRMAKARLRRPGPA